MKKLVMVSLVLGIALGLMFADASAGIKQKKGVRVGVEQVTDVTTGTSVQSSSKPTVQQVTTAPADGIILGNTDYDYGWNSGSRQNIVLDASGKVHFQWMYRNGAAGAAPLNRRSIQYQTYDWGTSTLTTAADVKPKSVAASGFGTVDVFQSGDAAGIAAVCGHTPNWFALDAGPGAASFTYTNIRPSGSLDPSLTIDQASVTKDIYWIDNDGGRTNIFMQKSNDYGTSWAVLDSHLVAPPHAMGNLDNQVLVAPNGDLYLPTCITGLGSIDVVGPDSADAVGYYKSTNQGSNWTWTTLARDGENVVYGLDTVQNFFENFGSMDAVIDQNNNLHIVIEGYGAKLVYRTLDTVTANFFGTLYWKTGQTGFKLISRVEDAHVADFDSSYYVWSNNAIGHPYPSITVDPAGNGLFAIWSQTRINDPSRTISFSWNGICNYDLWYSYSKDLGTTWSTAVKLANTDGGLFVSTAPALTKPDGNTYRAHFVYLADTAAGNSTTITTGAPMVNYIYRTVDFSSVTGINSNTPQPVTFYVAQNFPNPFNPTTEIRYEIGAQSMVTLKVYNVMGQEVATLVNEVKNRGNHSVTFDASTLASGVYLYKLQAGSFAETKKMILMK